MDGAAAFYTGKPRGKQPEVGNPAAYRHTVLIIASMAAPVKFSGRRRMPLRRAEAPAMRSEAAARKTFRAKKRGAVSYGTRRAFRYGSCQNFPLPCEKPPALTDVPPGPPEPPPFLAIGWRTVVVWE